MAGRRAASGGRQGPAGGARRGRSRRRGGAAGTAGAAGAVGRGRGSGGSRCRGAIGAAGTDGTAGAHGTAGAGGTTVVVTPGDSVLMHHNHLNRDGVYVQPSLTKAAAAGLQQDTTFAASFVGDVYAQPLYVDNGPVEPISSSWRPRQTPCTRSMPRRVNRSGRPRSGHRSRWPPCRAGTSTPSASPARR